MYIFLIIYLIFLLAFVAFSAFIVYYSFKLGLGKNGRMAMIVYCLLVSFIIFISLILLSRCQWSWNIPLP